MAEVVSVCLLSSLRIFGVIIFLPFGDSAFFLVSRFLISVILGSFIFGAEVRPVTVSLLDFPKELFIGLLIGAPLALVNAALKSWGELLEQGRGQSIAQTFDPKNATNEASIGIFKSEYIIFLLLLDSLFPSLLKVVAISFSTLPLGEISLNLIYTQTDLFIRVLGKIFAVAFSALLPVSCVFILVDISVSFFAQLLPGLQLQSAMFLIKSLFLYLITIFLFQRGYLAGLVEGVFGVMGSFF